MRKILTILMLLALTVPAWAGEKTITISRNDVDWESANTVYNVTKGGVELVMSGGMNNPNFLLMKQHTTITVKSHNFNIKRIVFHCLDNYTNDNLDPFYWGPTTLHIQYSQTHAETAGTLTYNYGGSSYDALWVSTKSSSPGNYPNGLPAGYELMFENEGRPVRFASIDIVVEQEVGDIYELVTSQSEVQAGQTYILVGRQDQTTTKGRALSVSETSSTPSNTSTRKSTPVELIDNGNRVKATGDVQLIKLEATGNSSRPYYLKVGSNYLRRRSGITTTNTSNTGSNIYAESSPSSYEEYFRASILISVNYYNALIRFDHNSTETAAPENGVTRTFAIRHNNSYNYFRDIDYSSNNPITDSQRVFLYKPAQQYKVTTEVKPEASYGNISLSDGILVDNGTNWSQKMDTIQFLVTAADGKKISNIDIQALENNQVVEHISPLTTSQTINGTLYTFVMPGHDVNIVATFEDVEYHNINMVVKPNSVCGNIFITEGYVVQNDQVKSYDGQTVVFNVTPNPINPANESEGYYELSSVTITDNVTGVETTLVPDANGNYTFTMPDNEVTITANFRVKLMISTACDPSYGGYFEQSTMTCNGQSTNFYNGAQYYADDVMTFMVKTNYGYRINKVIVTDAFGMETTLTPTETYGDGNFYSFSMPNSNVTITAYFYEAEDDLYLIGQANGGDWAPNVGQKFNYDVDNSRYYLKVYFKGSGEYGGDPNNAFSEFNLTKKLANRPGSEGGWDDIENDRLGYTSYTDGGEPISNGEHKSLASGYDYKENKFKIPAGIYTIYVNRAKTDMWVQLEDVSLTFDPAGGTADNPEVVSKGTTVNIAGDIYSQIKAINPDEADANFKYKYDRSINGTSYTGDATIVSAGASTTTTLDVVNDGETVTQLDGYNYLGWIVASNTGYYKVISTPLHWIEEFGEKDKTYTVSDRLQGVYAQGGHLWCKDLGDISIVKTEPNTDQVDYLAKTLKTTGHIFADNMRIGNWDQSNWVELDFSGLGQQEGNAAATALVNKYIKAGTITGVYSDDINYTIKVSSTPEADGAASYVPNTYCTSNFIEENLKIGNNVGPTVNGTTYYFLNPKIQEYAIITFAMWDKPNQIMVVPESEPFNGAACISRWDLNGPGNQLEALDAAYEASYEAPETYNNLYEFHIIVQRTNKSYGSPISSGAKAGTDDQTASAVIRTQPLDLVASSPLPTAITTIGTEAQVVGVEYVNIAGMRSSKPWQGINIVVTRYSDGTTTTTKVVK